MTDRDRKLIIDNIKLCYFFFQRYNITDEDVRQILMTKLCEQIHHYDPARGGISTFFFAVLRSGYLQYLKDCNRPKNSIDRNAISIEGTCPFISGTEGMDSELTLYDVIPDDSKSVEDIISDDNLVNNIYRNLPRVMGCSEDDVEFLKLRLTNPLSTLAKRYGVTTQRIDKRYSRLIGLIKELRLYENNPHHKRVKQSLDTIIEYFTKYNKQNPNGKPLYAVIVKDDGESNTPENQQCRSYIISSEAPLFNEDYILEKNEAILPAVKWPAYRSYLKRTREGLKSGKPVKSPKQVKLDKCILGDDPKWKIEFCFFMDIDTLF